MFGVPTGSSNEGQFAFSVESIVMAQKLRGTLTYVIKVLCCFLLFSVISVPWWRRESVWGQRDLSLVEYPLVEFRFKLSDPIMNWFSYDLNVSLSYLIFLSCHFYCRMTKARRVKRWIFLSFYRVLLF